MGKGSETQWLTSWVAQERRTFLQGNVGHMRVAFWNRLNQKGRWQEGFAVLSGWGSPWFLSKMWLGSLNDSAGRKGNTIKGEYAGMHQVHSIRRVSERTLSGGAEWGKKLGIRPFKILSILPHVNSAQAINFSPHSTTDCSLHKHTHSHTHEWYIWLRRTQSLDMDGWILGHEFPTLCDLSAVSYHSNIGTETRGLHLNRMSPSLPPIPLGTGQQAGCMGRGLKAQANVYPSRLLLKCIFIHCPPSTWQPGNPCLSIKEVQNDFRNIRGEVRCQSWMSSWDCCHHPWRAGIWWAIWAQGLATHLDTVALNWKTLETAGELVEERGGGEWANHEMGLGACYSANSRLSHETIVRKGDREGGTRSGNLNVRAVKRAAAQQLDSRSTLRTNPLASKSARSEVLLAACEGAGSLAHNWFCPSWWHCLFSKSCRCQEPFKMMSNPASSCGLGTTQPSAHSGPYSHSWVSSRGAGALGYGLVVWSTPPCTYPL